MLPGTYDWMEDVLFRFHGEDGEGLMIGKRKLAASITVEASLTVPVFFLAVLVFLYLFECLNLQNDLQNQLWKTGENYAFYGIQTPYLCTGDGQRKQVNWHVSEGKGYCDAEVDRTIPGLPSWMLQIHIYQRVQVHNYSGRSMVGQTEGENGPFVYVAENGTVYHTLIDCTYLHLGIQTVAKTDVDERRNRSGARYKPCESCVRDLPLVENPFLYITPYGVRYHRTKDCSGLRRTVRRVLISAVNLPPCSKCGK